MKVFFLPIGVLANTGSVELSSVHTQESLADVRLGQLLADQLRVAPSVSSVQEAKEVHALAGATLLNKPPAVLVAVMDGADGPGTPLASQCTARTECVGKVCYSTTASCVMHKLVSQTDAQVPLAALVAQTGAVTAVSSDPHLAAAGYGKPHLAAHDMVAKTAIYGLSTGEHQSKVDLNNLAAHHAELAALVDGLHAKTGVLTLRLGDHEVALDLGNQCVRTVLGEALAIAQIAQQPGDRQFYMVAPRGVACMAADFGHSSTEKAVAQKILERAVSSAEKRLGAWTMKVRLPSPESSGDAVVAPQLLAQARRLSAHADQELGVQNAQVADYHIFLWSTIAIFLSLYAAVYAITGMTGSRDPLLYAKFRPDVDPSARR